MGKAKPEWIRLADVGTIYGGGTPSKSRPSFWGGDIPWISPKIMKTAVIGGSPERITKAGLEATTGKLIPPAAVLFVVRGMILARDVPVAVNTCPLVINQDMKAILPRKGVDAFYLATMMRGAERELLNMVDVAGHGTCKLTTERWSELRIPLPSINDQRRIVARTRELTQRAEEVRNTAREREAQLDILLQAFYHRIIDGVKWKPLGEVASLIRRPVQITPHAEYEEMGVRSFGKGTFRKPVLTGTQIGSKRIYRIHKGDLVFNNVFAWEKAIAVAGKEDQGRVGSHRFITYVPHEGKATPEFLCLHFLGDRGIEDIRAASPGSAGRNRTLGLKKLELILVPVPSYGDQRRCAELVKRRQVLQQQAAEIENDIKAFTAALLAEAFRGEL